jgi:hypothetical protein
MQFVIVRNVSLAANAPAPDDALLSVIVQKDTFIVPIPSR